MPAGDRLQLLLDERDILRVLYLYARGVDRWDGDLIRSCFHDDAILEYGAPADRETMVARLLQNGERYLTCEHFIYNAVIDVDGDSAHTECSCFSPHRYPANGDMPESDLFWAGRYVDRFERRDGEWRIAHRLLINEWSSVVEAPPSAPAFAAFRQGQRSRDDAVYGWPASRRHIPT